MSKRFANALLEMGFKKRDRIATLSVNLPQYIIAINTFLKIGIIEVPANPFYTLNELKQQFNDSQSETIVVMAPYLSKAISLMKDPDCYIKRVIVFGVQDTPTELDCIKGVYDMDELCHNACEDEPDVEILAYDVVRFQYTGGTTGIPKGCMITNYMAHTQGLRGAIWFTQNFQVISKGEIRVLAAVPIYHVYGWNFAINICLHSGGSLVLFLDQRQMNYLKQS